MTLDLLRNRAEIVAHLVGPVSKGRLRSEKRDGRGGHAERPDDDSTN